MLYQSILQIGLHKRKSKNVFFFSNLQMIWTVSTSTSFMSCNKQTINKLFLASWHHNLIIGFLSLSYAMALEAELFMVILKKNLCKSKVSLENGWKIHFCH
jgi:hypothetical protein